MEPRRHTSGPPALAVGLTLLILFALLVVFVYILSGLGRLTPLGCTPSPEAAEGFRIELGRAEGVADPIGGVTGGVSLLRPLAGPEPQGAAFPEAADHLHPDRPVVRAGFIRIIRDFRDERGGEWIPGNCGCTFYLDKAEGLPLDPRSVGGPIIRAQGGRYHSSRQHGSLVRVPDLEREHTV